MPIRYRLLPLSPANLSSPQLLLEKLGGFVHSPLATLSTGQWSSALHHVASMGANSILLQEAVLDPDFLEEYEAFYSKQQRPVQRLCCRAHFFKMPDDPDQSSDPDKVLEFIDSAADQSDSYLGFITLRPLRHAPVGASILNCGTADVVTCKDEFPVHIAGRDFSAIGTPYLQQDNAVGACAQASIWIALRTLRRRLGNSAYSPAELTVAATKHLALNRVFPGRQGLNSAQMLEAIRSAGHDPLIFDLSNPSITDPADAAINFATPYLESGLPVILGLDSCGGHAVTAIGYKPPPLGQHIPNTLIIHNDNTGCYLDLPGKLPAGTVGYALSQTKVLITPLPDGISITAAEVGELAVSAATMGLKLLEQSTIIASMLAITKPTINVVFRTFLSTRHSFRKWAVNSPDIDDGTRKFYRTTELPKHIWVVELHDPNIFQRGILGIRSRLGEVIFDASADALHGDALLAMRLSGLIFGAAFPSCGLLYSEDYRSGPEILAIDAPAAEGQERPWL